MFSAISYVNNDRDERLYQPRVEQRKSHDEQYCVCVMRKLVWSYDEDIEDQEVEEDEVAQEEQLGLWRGSEQSCQYNTEK